MPPFWGRSPGTDSRSLSTEAVVEINTTLCSSQLSLQHPAWPTSCKWSLLGSRGVVERLLVCFVLCFPFPTLRIYFALKSQQDTHLAV